MANDDTTGILAALDELLDGERAALLAGDLGGLPDLLDRKTKLMDRLGAIEGVIEHDTRPNLAQMKDKAMRNQALLDGALQGIRQVAGRIAALRHVRRSFDTYDVTGRRLTIDAGSAGRVEKRA